MHDALAGCRLAEALPGLRHLEGFPSGEDEAILGASLPPRYTACPSPFLGEFVGGGRGGAYECGAFAADVREGRNDPIYRAQVYHTKVPPLAIARYIEHFTEPGDVVFDGFCGSGMTGVAARMTGRRAVLVDLSPAATAIAASYCLPVDPAEAEAAFAEVLGRLREACGWMYEDAAGREMDYVVWSEVYRCPHCGAENPFSEMGFDFETKRPREEITCPQCEAEIMGTRLGRVLDETGMTGEVAVRAKHVGDVGDGAPDWADLELVRRATEAEVGYWFPEAWMMGKAPGKDGWGDMWRRGYHTGVVRVRDFYSKRTLHVIAAALAFAREVEAVPEVRHLVQQTVINASINLTKMRRAYQPPVPLVLYFPRLRRECNVVRMLETRFEATMKAVRGLPRESEVIISTQSSGDLRNLPDECVDYIFTDPPFGQNIIYSEVNFLWESWLGITTAQEREAIVSEGQGKGVSEYRDLMMQCFREFWRVLKPGRWMTVEFHNSKNEVWTAIQEALEGAGYVVEDVRVLDKGGVSFKQASTENAVQGDLCISARKGTGTAHRRDAENAENGRGERLGGEDGEGEEGREQGEDVWGVVAEWLAEEGGGRESDARRLYTRMVAHWISRGWRVPMDADEFYRGLRERFGGSSGGLTAQGSGSDGVQR